MITLLVNYILLFLLIAISLGCAPNIDKEVEADLIEAMNENKISSYHLFLIKYRDHPYINLYKERMHPILDKAKLKIEDLNYEYAQNSNSIFGYEEYLLKYPKGNFVTEVNLRINDILRNERSELLKGIKKIKVIDNIKYVDFTPDQLAAASKRICGIISAFLDCAGYTIVDNNDTSSNATINIVGSVELIGGLYSKYPHKTSEFYYTSVDISIGLVFNVNAKSEFETPYVSNLRFPRDMRYAKKMDLPQSISSMSKDTIFINAIETYIKENLIPNFLDKSRNLYGPSTLIKLLYMECKRYKKYLKFYDKAAINTFSNYEGSIKDNIILNALKYKELIKKSEGKYAYEIDHNKTECRDIDGLLMITTK
jgi:hypothetical protein